MTDFVVLVCPSSASTRAKLESAQHRRYQGAA